MKHLSFATLLVLFSATSWAGLEQCQQLNEQQERLACSEKLLKAYESYFVSKGLPLLSAQQPSKEVKELAAKQAKDDFGREQQKLAEKKKELETLEATVKQVKKNAYGKLTLTLDNQQIWKLTDKGPRIKKGDAIVIERGTLGSFFIKKAGTSRKARAKRVK